MGRGSLMCSASTMSFNQQYKLAPCQCPHQKDSDISILFHQTTNRDCQFNCFLSLHSTYFISCLESSSASRNHLHFLTDSLFTGHCSSPSQETKEIKRPSSVFSQLATGEGGLFTGLGLRWRLYAL